MSRSILPSKNREAARKAKTSLERRVRRTVRIDLHRDDPRIDLLRDTNQSNVRRILPKNLIGDHAYFHGEIARSHSRDRVPFGEQLRRVRQGFLDRTAHRLRRALELEPDRLGELNAQIKRRKPPEQLRRLLVGTKDVEAFVAAILFARLPPHLPYDWDPAFAIERELPRRFMAKDKVRDMIRSILPATNRESSRMRKKHETRRVRRTVRAGVRREDPRVELDLDADQSVNVFVRRAHDKLGPFIRWCRALTQGMPKVEALAFVRGILPRNVIGDHAFGHWEDEREPYRGPRYVEEKRRSMQSVLDRTRHRLRRALELAPEQLADLNAEIKRRKNPDQTRRLLLGIHDVDAFVEEVWFDPANPNGCRHDRSLPCRRKIERECLLEMLIAVEIAHGPKRPITRGVSVYPY